MIFMDRIEGINPDRIRWCCQDRGITTDALASELDIGESTLQRALDEGKGLTFNQLRRLAQYFGRGVLFFLESEAVDETSVHSPQFRTLANQKPELSPRLKALIERVERQREVYLSLREDLEEDGQPFAPPRFTSRDPATCAHVARRWLALPDQNDFNRLREAIETRGILVFRSNGYNGKWQIARESPILGFSLYHPVCPVIVIKKQHAESRQTFTLAHELGHLLLHKASSIDDEQDFHSASANEQEATAFAGHLLVPDAFLRSIDDALRPGDVASYDDWLQPFRKAWGVSTEVILRRLLDSGRLDEESYAAYRRWRATTADIQGGERGSREYRFREPGHIFGESFVRTVLDALNARQITLARASGYLDSLKISDLRRLERHYAGA